MLCKEEKLFLDIDIVRKSLKEFKELLHREHSVGIIIHYDEDPKVNEAQSAVARILH